MIFKAYSSKDAFTIIKYINNEEDFYKWSAGVLGIYPITSLDFDKNMQQRTITNQAFPLVAYENNQMIGFLLLRYLDQSKKEMRLGFIIIDPSLRGKGLGTKMVKEAIQYCFEQYDVNRVSLGVFENNQAALHCYLKAGLILKDEIEIYEFNSYKWICLELYLDRKDFYETISKKNH